jgi:hypothetical protein
MTSHLSGGGGDCQEQLGQAVARDIAPEVEEMQLDAPSLQFLDDLERVQSRPEWAIEFRGDSRARRAAKRESAKAKPRTPTSRMPYRSDPEIPRPSHTRSPSRQQTKVGKGHGETSANHPLWATHRESNPPHFCKVLWLLYFRGPGYSAIGFRTGAVPVMRGGELVLQRRRFEPRERHA